MLGCSKTSITPSQNGLIQIRKDTPHLSMFALISFINLRLLLLIAGMPPLAGRQCPLISPLPRLSIPSIVFDHPWDSSWNSISSATFATCSTMKLSCDTPTLQKDALWSQSRWFLSSKGVFSVTYAVTLVTEIWKFSEEKSGFIAVRRTNRFHFSRVFRAL